MPWTIEDIEREWLVEGEGLMFPRDDLLRAFEVAEAIRGPEWVRSCTYLPNGGRQWGFSALLRVMTFAQRARSAEGAVNLSDLHSRLQALDAAADSELTAIHLLRGDLPDLRLEIAPTVQVGSRFRRPDFRIRAPSEGHAVARV